AHVYSVLGHRARDRSTNPPARILLEDFRIVTTFGTGGTATGLSKYTQKKYGKKNLHIVYPLNNQDVARIRTKDKSIGLKFYRPDQYLGQHEADFAAKPSFRYLVRKGYDIRSEEHTSELQSRFDIVCRLLLEKK